MTVQELIIKLLDMPMDATVKLEIDNLQEDGSIIYQKSNTLYLYNVPEHGSVYISDEDI